MSRLRLYIIFLYSLEPTSSFLLRHLNHGDSVFEQWPTDKRSVEGSCPTGSEAGSAAIFYPRPVIIAYTKVAILSVRGSILFDSDSDLLGRCLVYVMPLPAIMSSGVSLSTFPRLFGGKKKIFKYAELTFANNSTVYYLY